MAIGVVFEFPGVTAEQYDAVCSLLHEGGLHQISDWPVEGIVSHVAGPTAHGWRVVDVWDSEESFGRFGQMLMPLLEPAGIPQVEPQVFPAHNVVT